MKSSRLKLYKDIYLINSQILRSQYSRSRNSKSTMPQEQCPGREGTGYNNVEEVTFQIDDLPPQLENELEYAWGNDESGNGDDIDNEAPPVLVPNYPRLSFDNILSWRLHSASSTSPTTATVLIFSSIRLTLTFTPSSRTFCTVHNSHEQAIVTHF